jgi:CheY-like chemotaxis protein
MRETGGKQFQVLGDQPYDKSGDPFGFGDLARDLKRLVLSSRESTPFAIGIEASWGRGKSSLMKQLERELSVKANGVPDSVEIRTVSFNAWTAEDEDVLEGLVKSVLQAMDKNILRRALRKRRFVSILKIPLLLVAGWLRVGALVNEAWEQLSVDAHTRNQVNDVVREAMNAWLEKSRRKTGKPSFDRLLVVFIDDLDRCSPESVLKVFEGLKLYLNVPGFVFVIGYDEVMISDAVADQKKYSATATGRNYIEKIVQIVFRIPHPSDEEVETLLGAFLDESRTALLFDDPGRKLLIERNGRNPRRMKRFVNRFILDYQLDEASQDMQGQLLIKLLILETYFPEFIRLFTTGEAKNPIQEFLDFAAASDALRRGNADDSNVEPVLTFYEISAGAPTDELLTRLQAIAPETFVRLANDVDFRSLADGLSHPDDQAVILAKVRRRRERETQVPATESAAQEAPISSQAARGLRPIPEVAGRRILWIDDKPENNFRLVEALRSSGADVETMLEGESAVTLLPSLQPDLIISDIGRGERREAGFEDVEMFRERDLHDGPVVFYTARVTGARRTRAREIGAKIASTEDELITAVADALRPQTLKTAPVTA